MGALALPAVGWASLSPVTSTLSRSRAALLRSAGWPEGARRFLWEESPAGMEDDWWLAVVLLLAALPNLLDSLVVKEDELPEAVGALEALAASLAWPPREELLPVVVVGLAMAGGGLGFGGGLLLKDDCRLPPAATGPARLLAPEEEAEEEEAKMEGFSGVAARFSRLFILLCSLAAAWWAGDLRPGDLPLLNDAPLVSLSLAGCLGSSGWREARRGSLDLEVLEDCGSLREAAAGLLGGRRGFFCFDTGCQKNNISTTYRPE